MLLRNMHDVYGQVDVTRSVVCKNESQVVEAQILTGYTTGMLGYIPCNKFTNINSPLPFEL